MKFLFLLINLLVVFGCGRLYDINEKERLVNRVLLSSAKKIKKEIKLNPCGTGAEMMYEIKMLSLSFFCYEDICIEDGRDLLIYTSNVLADEINKSSEIHKYLYHYPFSPMDTEILIVIKNPDGSVRSPEKLRVISLVKGRLRYKTGRPDSNLLNTIYEENYEEAITKLKNASDFSENVALLKREKID